jgi:hypothetical protein
MPELGDAYNDPGNQLKYIGVLPKDDVLETLLTYLPML